MLFKEISDGRLFWKKFIPGNNGTNFYKTMIQPVIGLDPRIEKI